MGWVALLPTNNKVSQWLIYGIQAHRDFDGMTFDEPLSFRSLAGVEPGVTTQAEVREQFGEPEKVSKTKNIPKHIAGGDPGGDLVWDYETRGITLHIYSDRLEMPNPIIDEVRVYSPFTAVLPCGLHIGQSISLARSIIASMFLLTEEYEDAIYFKTSNDEALVACVENWDAEEIVAIELMYRRVEGNQDDIPPKSACRADR